MQFRDRFEGGRLLARKLAAYADRPDTTVLALPRGGVPVGYEISRELNLPLDVFLVRKLGVPGHEELAMGAIASGGVRILNEQVVHFIGISAKELDWVTAEEQLELERREKLYRGGQELVNVRGRTVIVVDDGLATGSTMRAAVTALRLQDPARIIVAAPVAARQTCDSFQMNGDSTCVCVMTPEPFDGVGRWYQDFSQTTDEEVRSLLDRAKRELHRQVA